MKTLLFALSLNLLLIPGVLNAQENVNEDFKSPVDTTTLETWEQDTVFENKILSVHIYPNPASTSLRLIPRGEGEMNLQSVEIISQSGSLLTQTTPAYQRTVDISSLEAGFYVIRMVSDTGTFQSRFIKQ